MYKERLLKANSKLCHDTKVLCDDTQCLDLSDANSQNHCKAPKTCDRPTIAGCIERGVNSHGGGKKHLAPGLREDMTSVVRAKVRTARVGMDRL